MSDAPEKRRPGRPRKQRVDPPSPIQYDADRAALTLQVGATSIKITDSGDVTVSSDESPKRPPAARGLGALELRAILDDAMRAQEEHDRSFRTDSMGRHWTFTDAQSNNHAVFQISLRRMNDVREATISAGEFGTDGIRERVAKHISDLSEALA